MNVYRRPTLTRIVVPTEPMSMLAAVIEICERLGPGPSRADLVAAVLEVRREVATWVVDERCTTCGELLSSKPCNAMHEAAKLERGL
jgi:hypothetical protein